MSRRVVKLFACPIAQSESRCILEAWRLALCLIWCIWIERNARSFEDFERSVIKLKAVMFKSLYAWMAIVLVSLVFLHFWTCVLFLLLN
jgi:hypothetical protein